MKVVFDLDNTLADEFGSTARPGVAEFLDRLRHDGHELILWTNSKRARAVNILREHGFTSVFAQSIYREDYDPNNTGAMKDIRRVKGDILIDDDPAEIAYVDSLGLRGILISPFRKGMCPDESELDRLYIDIGRTAGFWSRFFK